MRDMGRIQGSEAQAKELIIGVDTVYVHSNIEQKETEYGSIYEYDEIQYNKDEYITLMSERISKEEEKISDIRTDITEIDEDLELSELDITDVQMALIELDNRLRALEA